AAAQSRCSGGAVFEGSIYDRSRQSWYWAIARAKVHKPCAPWARLGKPWPHQAKANRARKGWSGPRSSAAVRQEIAFVASGHVHQDDQRVLTTPLPSTRQRCAHLHLPPRPVESKLRHEATPPASRDAAARPAVASDRAFQFGPQHAARFQPARATG